MGIPSNRRSAVEPEKRGRIVYQAAKAGTDHDDAVFEFLAFEDQRFEVDRPATAQP